MNSLLPKILIGPLLLIVCAGISVANDPADDTPWPVGTDTTNMRISRTLMNSYGDLNGSWSYSLFHAGIDIDATTGSPDCNQIRCVDDGYATLVQEIEIPGSDGDYQYLVIICDDIGGSVQHGWSYGHLTQPSFFGQTNPPVSLGQLIGEMTTDITTPHVHFMWTDWDNNAWSYCNPLGYLDAAPIFEENYQWIFNPENNSPRFDYFFLPQIWFSDWDTLSISETQNMMLDESSISGNVDLFFGVSLRGEGMPFGQGDGRIDLTSQKIRYDVIRKLTAGVDTLETRHVFDFDCVLNTDTTAPDARPQMLYFRHSMDALFGHDALAYCLTNCESVGDWNGINTIQENSWNTDAMEVDVSTSTVNPVLAGYPDGEYRVDVLCYSFDDDYTFNDSIVGIELHNFHPALGEVKMIDAVTDGIYYQAYWIPDATGLAAELHIAHNLPVPPGTVIEVVLVFTEEMNTSSVSASLGSLPITGGSWSSSVVADDTWTGSTTIPVNATDENCTLSVSASDTDSNSLMDPEGAGTVPGPSSDTHHIITVGDGTAIELDWTASVHSPVLSSPKLADIDMDGDLDVIIQCSDGWIDVLDDDGSSMSGWPVSGGWSTGDPDVKASPAIVNLVGDLTTAPEILAVHPSGSNGFMANGTSITGWTGIYSSDYEWHVLSSPVAGDFNNDSDYEYVLGRQHETSSSNGHVFYGQEANGTSIWSKNWGYYEAVSSTPSLCDVDNDGELEALVITDYLTISPMDDYGTLYCLDASTGTVEWSYYSFGMFIWGAVVTGNLDSDPQMEIIASGTAGGPVTRVIDGTSGTPQDTKSTGTVYAGASVSDVDNDGDLDVVVSSSSSGGTLHCWNGATGDYLPGFPLSLGTYTKTGVSLGDIDADGYQEILIAGTDGKLHSINHDGTETGGFPITVSSNQLSGQPALGDIDGDGRLEIVFGEQNNSVIHCYEMGENSAYTSLSWPQFQFDAMNSGCYVEVNEPPAPPTDFEGDGELSGSIFTVDLTWTVSVNDPTSPTPQLPTDVVSYNIYRKIPPRPVELITTVPAGTSDYSDVIVFTSLPTVVAYYASAWDGVNESEFTPVIKIIPGSLSNIASGCPVREINLSAAAGISQTRTSAGTGTSLSDIQGRSNCRILTDGEYEEAFLPAGSSDCVEIDLGDVFSITDVAVLSGNVSLSESFRYELSIDGRSFRRTDSGNSRYIRVYGAVGATEIEVYGETSSATSAPIGIQRSESDGYRIASVDGASLTVTVFDLMGRSIWRESSSAGEVLWNRCSSAVGTVPSGIYLLLIETEDSDPVTAKVVVR